MLWAVAASAGAPIVYGRFRPRSGALPKDTYKKSDSSWERAASCAAEERRSTGKGNRRSGHWRGGQASGA
jgi:hypothetical protein